MFSFLVCVPHPERIRILAHNRHRWCGLRPRPGCRLAGARNCAARTQGKEECGGETYPSELHAQRTGERWRRTRDSRTAKTVQPAAFRSTEKLANPVMRFSRGSLSGRTGTQSTAHSPDGRALHRLLLASHHNEGNAPESRGPPPPACGRASRPCTEVGAACRLLTSAIRLRFLRRSRS